MFVDVYEGFFAIDTNVIGIDFAGIQIIEKWIICFNQLIYYF